MGVVLQPGQLLRAWNVRALLGPLASDSIAFIMTPSPKPGPPNEELVRNKSPELPFDLAPEAESNVPVSAPERVSEGLFKDLFPDLAGVLDKALALKSFWKTRASVLNGGDPWNLSSAARESSELMSPGRIAFYQVFISSALAGALSILYRPFLPPASVTTPSPPESAWDLAWQWANGPVNSVLAYATESGALAIYAYAAALAVWRAGKTTRQDFRRSIDTYFYCNAAFSLWPSVIWVFAAKWVDRLPEANSRSTEIQLAVAWSILIVSGLYQLYRTNARVADLVLTSGGYPQPIDKQDHDGIRSRRAAWQRYSVLMWVAWPIAWQWLAYEITFQLHLLFLLPANLWWWLGGYAARATP